MTSKEAEYGSPWYQNFWPWFIVGLLGVSVVGSLMTVVIAYRNSDVDVRRIIPVEAPAASTPLDREPRDSGR